MHKIVILFLITFVASAKEWKKISPIESCPEVVLEYQKYRKKFKVRLPKTDFINFYIETSLRDLNDLSKLTEYLEMAKADFCPDRVYEQSSQQCQEEKEDYSKDFVDLFKEITSIVNKDKNGICGNLLPFFKLQDQISQLTENDFIKAKKTRNLLGKFMKLFTDSQSDKLIDHFYACGGKRGSADFIRNIILLEADAACIAPKPKGALSWDQATEIAVSVASEYKGSGIIKINNKQSEITKKAVLKFADKITFDQVEGLMDSFFEGTKPQRKQQMKDFIKGLDSYKGLQDTKSKDIASYVNYTYAVDTPLEIGEKAIPFIIKKTFESRLPSSWSSKDKDLFITNILTKKATQTYQSCIADEKEYVGDNIEFTSDDEKLKFRKKLKENFCLKNPDQCSDNKCQGTVNMLSDTKTTDTQKVQGCIIKGITLGIKPLIRASLNDQKDKLKSLLTLSDEMVTHYTNESWDTMLSCINKQVKDEFQSSEAVDILSQQKWFEKINTQEYEKYVMNCSELVEKEATEKIITQVLVTNESLVEAFHTPPYKTDQFGHQTSASLEAKAFEIKNSSLVPCMEKQKKLGMKDPVLCSASIQLKAATEVIEKLLKDKNINNDPTLSLEVKDFRACALDALLGSIDNLGNESSSTPINTSKQAEKYLDTNPHFYNCVKESIGDFSYQVAGMEFKDIYEQNKDKVKNRKYLASMGPIVQREIRECFNKEIEKRASYWSNFLEFNEKKGLSIVENLCKDKTTASVLSKVVVKEAISQLSPLVEDGFLESKNQIYDTLAEYAIKLKKEKNIQVPSSVSPSRKTHYIIQQYLNAHIKSGKGIDSFLKTLTPELENLTISKVHKNLISKVSDTSFTNSFNKSCLLNLYKALERTKESESKSSTPITMSKLATLLKSALNYSKKLGQSKHTIAMNSLKNECQNFKTIKTQKELYKTSFYKMIIKGEVYNEFSKKFTDGIIQNLKDKEESLTNPHITIKKQYTKKMLKETKALLEKHTSAPMIEKSLFSDSEITDFVSTNLDAILSKDQNITDILTNKLLKKTFKDKGDHSFSDQFTKIQVIGNLGISGIDQTFDQAKKGQSYLWGAISVGKKAGASAAKTFFKNTENIEAIVDWEKIPLSKRKILSESILNDAVLEATNKREIPTNVKKLNLDKLQKDIDSSVDRVTNGYQNYEKNIKAESEKLAKKFFSLYPHTRRAIKPNDLVAHFSKTIKKTHMDRNVTGMLLSHKYSGNKTIEDKITDKVTELGSDIWWNGTAEQKAARNKRKIQRLKTYRRENPLL